MSENYEADFDDIDAKATPSPAEEQGEDTFDSLKAELEALRERPMDGQEFERGKAEKPVIGNGANYYGILEALQREGVQVRRNTLKQCTEFKTEDGDWEQWSAHRLDAFRAYLETRYIYAKNSKPAPFKFTADGWKQHFSKAAEEFEVNPVKDWLEDLVADEHECWEAGSETIWKQMRDWFDLEDTPLNRWAATALWVGPVERIFNPGCRQRIVVVLAGEQGSGKSSFIEEMLPPELRQLPHRFDVAEKRACRDGDAAAGHDRCRVRRAPRRIEGRRERDQVEDRAGRRQVPAEIRAGSDRRPEDLLHCRHHQSGACASEGPFRVDAVRRP